MKTAFRISFCYLLLITFMWSTIPLLAQGNSSVDYRTISGVVKDKTTGKKLKYVNLAIPGTNLGTVTNEDGAFSFKIKDNVHAKLIKVTHIGYFSTQIDLNGQDMNDLTVAMTQNTNMLAEVIIRARDPRYIVEEAVRKIPVNYCKTNSLMTGFYRETAEKGRHYINISEAIVNIFKTNYKTTSADFDRVQIYKGRKLLSQKASDTLAVKLLGGPNLSLYIDITKNQEMLLDQEELQYYKFWLEEATTIDKRPQYVISFEPQAILPYALYEGRLFIDKETLSFTRAEFNLDMQDKNKATQAILRKKPFGLKFKPVEVSYIVDYTQHDGCTFLSYVRNDVRFKCDWKRKLFSTNYEIVSEMVVTDTNTENVTNISHKSAFNSMESLDDKVLNFSDDNFWGDYNIIEPTESLEHAVNKLKKNRKEE